MSEERKKLSVLLVEDSPLLRDIVIENLSSLEQVEVVAMADKQSQALSEIEKHKPELVIIDLELLEGNGIGVLKEIKLHPEKFGTPLKLVFTNHTSPVMKKKCLELGIEGFFDKSYQLFDMLDCIEEIIAA